MLQRRGLGAGDGLETASSKEFRPKLYRAECGFSNETNSPTSWHDLHALRRLFLPQLPVGHLSHPRSSLLISGPGGNSAGACQPLGLTGISVIHGVKDEFDAGRDAKLFEDPKEILFYRVLTEIEFASDLAVAQAFSDQGDHLFFARSEQASATRVDNAQRRHFRNQVHQIVKLFGVGPDLSGGYAQQTLA